MTSGTYLREEDFVHTSGPDVVSINESVELAEKAMVELGSPADGGPDADIQKAVKAAVAERAEYLSRPLTDLEIQEIIEEESRNSAIIGTAEGTYRTCPEDSFDLNHFVSNADRMVVTPERVSKLREVYDTILTPVVQFYGPAENGCRLVIVNGLSSQENVVSSISGHMASQHVVGRAVDFRILGVSVEQLFRDIADGLIGVDFGGIIRMKSYVHVTVPYEIDGHQIRGLAIEPDALGSDNDLSVVWT